MFIEISVSSELFDFPEVSQCLPCAPYCVKQCAECLLTIQIFIKSVCTALSFADNKVDIL